MRNMSVGGDDQKKIINVWMMFSPCSFAPCQLIVSPYRKQVSPFWGWAAIMISSKEMVQSLQNSTMTGPKTVPSFAPQSLELFDYLLMFPCHLTISGFGLLYDTAAKQKRQLNVEFTVLIYSVFCHVGNLNGKKCFLNKSNADLLF